MLDINADRLWQSVMEMATVGAGRNGGSRRLALSAEDAAGRELFSAWCREAGLTLSTDRIGNLFARRSGRDAGRAPVAIGSHLDTQPEGGRFDGVYGVLAGLEVIRTLNDAAIVTEAPIEIVVWTNEEGARFTPAMLGSAVFTGLAPLEGALATRDANGVSVGEALTAMDYVCERAVPGIRYAAYLEAHIEQGPVLEENEIDIGVVTGGQAIRWLDVRVGGRAAHAGTTPMSYRKDALFAAAEMAGALESIAQTFAPHGLTTIGEWHISAPSRNTIAGEVAFTVDLRNPSDEAIARMDEAVRERFQAVATRRGVTVAISNHWISASTPFDETCIHTVQQAVDTLGYTNQRIVSGAGHDAVHLAKYCPTAMIFIPCVGGLSHNEAEDVHPDHATRGANVLLHAVLARAVSV